MDKMCGNVHRRRMYANQLGGDDIPLLSRKDSILRHNCVKRHTAPLLPLSRCCSVRRWKSHLTNSDQTPGSFSLLGNPCCNEANTAVLNVDALDLRAPGEMWLRARETADGKRGYDMLPIRAW